jgi:polar amino acid transport system substrate-binding protein
VPKLLTALLLLTLSDVSVASDRALRFSINDSWAMPMVRIENGKAVEGILVDLQQRMAAKVERKAELVVMPRMRVQQALDTGEIDVRCYVSPNWGNSGHYRYIWSLPFMVQRDVLVSTQPGAALLEQLQNERIGTVLGFSYPRLEPLFKSGQLRREDARTQTQVLLKLSARRYDYAISNELSLHWFNRNKPAVEKLHVLSEVASDNIACIVRNEPDVPTMALLRAMVQMKQAGEFDAILARYR